MITDYASLLAAVERRVVKDDLSDVMPTLVQLTESTLQRRLRTLDGETSVTIPVMTETVALPDDLLSIRSIHLAGDAAEGVPDLPLVAISAPSIASRFTGMEGTPTHYSRSGSTLRLTPPPGEEVSLVIDYQAKFTPLTEIATNWIIRDHPDVYFYGTVAQAFADDQDEKAGSYAQLFDAMVSELILSRAKDKWGPGLGIPPLVRQVSGARC